MKVYVDDNRKCPVGWELARNYKEAITLLRTGEVTCIDMDYDLGERKNGVDIMHWIQISVKSGKIPKPEIFYHSANPFGNQEMIRIGSEIELRHKILSVHERISKGLLSVSNAERQYIEEAVRLLNKYGNVPMKYVGIITQVLNKYCR